MALNALGVELSPEERARLQSFMTVVSLPRDTVVIRPPQAHHALHVVEEGLLEVVVAGRVVARVGPGSWVGEVGLLDPGPASATVRTLTDTVTLTLDPVQLDALVRDEPAIARAVVRAMARSLAQRLRDLATVVVADPSPASIGEADSARGWFSRMFGRLGGGAR